MLMPIHDGQCGLCSHFGEHHNEDQQLVQIRTNGQAPDEVLNAPASPARTRRSR
jgi:hypothetical protein